MGVGEGVLGRAERTEGDAVVLPVDGFGRGDVAAEGKGLEPAPGLGRKGDDRGHQPADLDGAGGAVAADADAVKGQRVRRHRAADQAVAVQLFAGIDPSGAVEDAGLGKAGGAVRQGDQIAGKRP